MVLVDYILLESKVVAGGKTVINNIKLFIHVTNFADSRSLLTHPASTTQCSKCQRREIAGGVKQETIRMSLVLKMLKI